MSFIHILLLGLVQGVTEFLPISSSAHLILLPLVFSWTDQGLHHDIAAHVGTLAAVLFYFRRDVSGMLRSVRPGGAGEDRLLLGYVVVGTAPIILAGLALHALAADTFRDPLIIAAATVGFGLLLWWADRRGTRERDVAGMSWRDALFIGVAQCLAIIPGTSRAGITITAALMLGMTRAAAARFSFLLSIPAIGLAGLYLLYGMEPGALPGAGWSLAATAATSAVAAWLTIYFFIRFIERTGMLPYVIYRLLLGAVLFIVFT